MPLKKVTLTEKLAQFDSHWQPHIVADFNENEIMVAKFQGEFPFHNHPETDDLFLVIEGEVMLDGEDGDCVTLGPGDLCVVPKGMEHRPRAEHEAKVLLIEPKGTPNTGDAATAVHKPRL